MKACEPQDMAPFTVVANRFAIQQKVQSGGMGTIYRACDLQTNEPVALKLMLRSTFELEQKRFLQEAHLLSELRHPGIVSYVSHGITSDGRPYLAMAWLEGLSLAERLSTQPLSSAQSLLCIRNAAAALATAHQIGVVHRDLKPSNIFLRDGLVERTTILDFGIARTHQAHEALTVAGTVIGTPGYMAPEQARGQTDIDPSADIFSLGCVLFECLTGRSAFLGGDIVAILAKILCEEAPPLSMVRSGLPLELDHLLARMLAKDAEVGRITV